MAPFLVLFMTKRHRMRVVVLIVALLVPVHIAFTACLVSNASTLETTLGCCQLSADDIAAGADSAHGELNGRHCVRAGTLHEPGPALALFPERLAWAAPRVIIGYVPTIDLSVRSFLTIAHAAGPHLIYQYQRLLI